MINPNEPQSIQPAQPVADHNRLELVSHMNSAQHLLHQRTNSNNRNCPTQHFQVPHAHQITYYPVQNQTTHPVQNQTHPVPPPLPIINISNNLERQQSFVFEDSNITSQVSNQSSQVPAQVLRSCTCSICIALKNCLQNLNDKPPQNCSEDSNTTVIINNNNSQDSQGSKKFKYFISVFIIICNLSLEFKVDGAISYNYEYCH
ncbi:39166_t:CDS:2 [Gigaspora margarita]|uniref:39166_t:CDS:1 n=1 Tax=Gigaspora margarita TaxID=4874 RepID=A0ABM8VZF8_GIGMA|nr:39166_t:CDS:2 [Gigaspora margarita]